MQIDLSPNETDLVRAAAERVGQTLEQCALLAVLAAARLPTSARWQRATARAQEDPRTTPAGDQG